MHANIVYGRGKKSRKPKLKKSEDNIINNVKNLLKENKAIKAK